MAFTPRADWQLPYGVYAPWNIPVRSYAGMSNDYLGYDFVKLPYPAGEGTQDINGLTHYDYEYRHFYYSANVGTQWPPPRFILRGVDYNYTSYFASDATITVTLNCAQPTWGNLHGRTMPWNPAWKGAIGSDGQTCVLDVSNGYEYDIWQVGALNGTTLNCGSAILVQAGTGSGWGSPGDYRTKVNGCLAPRGVGIQTYAMLVTPEDVYSGRIKHALSMPIANPDPYSYVAPATKLEGNTGPTTALGAIPEGMRFALTGLVRDTEIGNWVEATHGNKSQAIQDFALIIGQALRDYGWFITDTSGAAGWQMESYLSAADLWADLGINWGTSTSHNYTMELLMEGLITGPSRNLPYTDENYVPANFNALTLPENYLAATTNTDSNGNTETLQGNSGLGITTSDTVLEKNFRLVGPKR